MAICQSREKLASSKSNDKNFSHELKPKTLDNARKSFLEDPEETYLN